MKVRIPDLAVAGMPIPQEEVVMQDNIDDYLQFGVPDVWVIDPWKHRGWRVSAEGWSAATDGIMRTADGRVAMPLKDVLLP